MAVGRRSALKVRASLFGVNRVFEHLVPVNLVTGVRHSVVLFSRVRNALCDVRSVRRDTAGDNAFFDVVQIGQPEMLGRGDVAEKICAARSSDRTADCGGDVVVAGSDVGYQRAENVERRVVTKPLRWFLSVRLIFIVQRKRVVHGTAAFS